MPVSVVNDAEISRHFLLRYFSAGVAAGVWVAATTCVATGRVSGCEFVAPDNAATDEMSNADDVPALRQRPSTAVPIISFLMGVPRLEREARDLSRDVPIVNRYGGKNL